MGGKVGNKTDVDEMDVLATDTSRCGKDMSKGKKKTNKKKKSKTSIYGSNHAFGDNDSTKN